MPRFAIAQAVALLIISYAWYFLLYTDFHNFIEPYQPIYLLSTSYNTPKAMAESMLKRFLQFKRALPADDNREVFKLILDNRYKLLGNRVTAAQRKDLIDKSENALSLLTLNTMIAEDNSLKESLKGDPSSIRNILNEIYDIVAKEVKKETDFETQLKAAENQYL